MTKRARERPVGRAWSEDVVRALSLAVDEPGDWQDLAACTEVDPDLHYPEKGQTGIEARMVCSMCPVRGPCLEFALTHEAGRFGIWAGTSEHERREIRRRRERRAA